ncbi:unnamed protein product [Allacma fusca]|uniref:Uncharacterized protein n=1 Tax=Allacma fusca TaxID=39272 RepID=A0A8J2NYV3_9HEXA|nr:unnamed protein product [Allacma fusca]
MSLLKILKRRNYVNHVLSTLIVIIIFLNILYFAALPGNSHNLSRGYLVNTFSCKIADKNPIDPALATVVGPPSKLICAEPVVRISNGTISLNEKHPKYNTATCCYKEIRRLTSRNYTSWTVPDWSVRYSSCHAISKSEPRTEMNSEFAKIECEFEKNGKIETSQDFVATVLSPLEHSKSTEAKYKYWKRPNSKIFYRKPPSVLIVGIDSVSRLHMMRSLPGTRKMLKAHDFVEMKGYTKIGENTFPNMMGGMGGMKFEDYPCWKTRHAKLDNCPFIWKNFSRNNYITGLIEDSAALGTFNFMKTGFVEQPTDYYLRPITTAYHGNINLETTYRGCVSGMNQTDFMMKYMREVIAGINNEIPYFIWAWFTTVAHDDFNDLQLVDNTFKRNLQELIHSEGKDTVILFISDHGYRFGKFRESFIGYYEESLPFFFIRLPPRLKHKYPFWSGICTPLVFKKFLYVRQFEKTHEVTPVTDSYLDYQIAFEVTPSGAKYEAKGAFKGFLMSYPKGHFVQNCKHNHQKAPEIWQEESDMYDAQGLSYNASNIA